MARRAGAKVISVPLNENDWSIPRQKLQEAFSPKTKLILINTPHNPTGKVLFFIHMYPKKSHFIMSYVSSSIPGKVLPQNKFGLKNVFSREVHKFGIALACMTFHTKFFQSLCILEGFYLPGSKTCIATCISKITFAWSLLVWNCVYIIHRFLQKATWNLWLVYLRSTILMQYWMRSISISFSMESNMWPFKVCQTC